MLDGFLASRTEEVCDESPDEIIKIRKELASLGVWTLGVASEHGGGGATDAVSLVAIERLARHWPAIAWAAVQTHAALDTLGGSGRYANLAEQLHAGDMVMAIIDDDAPAVRLTIDGQRIRGRVDRVDIAAPEFGLIVLGPSASATIIMPAGLRITSQLGRAGLDGAQTVALSVDATFGRDAAVLSEPAVGAGRSPPEPRGGRHSRGNQRPRR